MESDTNDEAEEPNAANDVIEVIGRKRHFVVASRLWIFESRQCWRPFQGNTLSESYKQIQAEEWGIVPL